MRVRNRSTLELTVPITLSELFDYPVGSLVTVDHYKREVDEHGFVKSDSPLIRVVSPDGYRVFHISHEEYKIPETKEGPT